MNKRIASLLLVGMLSMSVVGCDSNISSTVDEPVSNIVSLQGVDTVVVGKESQINITNIERKQDKYDYDYLEITYNFTNNGVIPTSASVHTKFDARQGNSICPYPVIDKYTEYEKEVVAIGDTITDCKVYFRLNKRSTENVILTIEECFSNNYTTTAYEININDMSITRVAN